MILTQIILMLQPHFIGEDTFGAGRSNKDVEAASLLGDTLNKEV